MPMRSGLAVYLYALPPLYGSIIKQEIGSQLENLTFSSISPGGFGVIDGLLRVRTAKAPRPQFNMFSRIAVMDGKTCVWLGELLNPAYGMNQSDGEYIKVSGLGIGNALRDSPGDWAYSAQTAQAIAKAQLSYRQNPGFNVTLIGILSTDQSQLFPDNPVNPITQVYSGNTMEEILSDIALLAGDYAWGVEPDPVQIDAAGFPLGRVFARARDLATADYTALLTAGDVSAYEFTPTADRAYNSIGIIYSKGTAGIGNATAYDSRLGADGSQNLAPFRYRNYQRDLSSLTVVNSTIAQNVANTYLGLFKNPTYTGRATLKRLRDGNGNIVPLWQATAANNLFVPELAILGQQLPTKPTQNNNLFWIAQSTYREDARGDQSVDLQLGYLPDSAGVQVARLQMGADMLARSGRKAASVQKMGAPMYGQFAYGFSNALAADIVGDAVDFPRQAYNVPASLTILTIVSNNINGLTATDFTAVGAYLYSAVTANGSGYARGTYKTNGNCLRHVDAESRRFAHHCDTCDREHHDLSLDEEAGHVLVMRATDHVGLSVRCPYCAGKTYEAYNLALTERDESDPWQWRAEQARHIRALMSAHGLTLA